MKFLGFGRKISFEDDLKVPPGYKLSFKDALHIVSHDMILGVLFPKWAMSATARLASARDAIDDLKVRCVVIINSGETQQVV